MDNVVFILSKDCMSCESLPLYGNTYWKTPNIDALAAHGTVFLRHYAAGGSTSMSLSAMLSGHYPYEFTSRKRYVEVIENEFPSIYETFQQRGYECHLIWDITWQDETWDLVKEFGDSKKVVVHSIDIAQPAGFHKSTSARLERNDALMKKTCELIYSEIDSIDLSKKQFIWMHLPHVLKGRRSYMDDMDIFDDIVGYVRNLVGDDSIYLTSDHGHMNMHKGLIGYGFHVYEPVVRIPLITPRIKNNTVVNTLTSNIDLPDIILNHMIPKRDFVLADTAYYAQPNRKLAVIADRFKYIYNKESKTEELYDLVWDPSENYNILNPFYYDKERVTEVIYDELYFYPYAEEAAKAAEALRTIKESVWREPSWIYGKYVWFRREVNTFKRRFRNMIGKIKG